MTYPAALPAPAAEGYGIEPIDPVIRTDMDAGPIRARRRYTNAPSRVSVTWVLTRQQFAVFEAWHKHTLQDGAASFSCPMDNGQGVTTWSGVRFAEMWKAQRLSPNSWRVQATLEAESRPTMSAEDLAGYL